MDRKAGTIPLGAQGVRMRQFDLATGWDRGSTRRKLSFTEKEQNLNPTKQRESFCDGNNLHPQVKEIEGSRSPKQSRLLSYQRVNPMPLKFQDRLCYSLPNYTNDHSFSHDIDLGKESYEESSLSVRNLPGFKRGESDLHKIEYTLCYDDDRQRTCTQPLLCQSDARQPVSKYPAYNIDGDIGDLRERRYRDYHLHDHDRNSLDSSELPAQKFCYRPEIITKSVGPIYEYSNESENLSSEMQKAIEFKQAFNNLDDPLLQKDTQEKSIDQPGTPSTWMRYPQNHLQSTPKQSHGFSPNFDREATIDTQGSEHCHEESTGVQDGPHDNTIFKERQNCQKESSLDLQNARNVVKESKNLYRIAGGHSSSPNGVSENGFLLNNVRSYKRRSEDPYSTHKEPIRQCIVRELNSDQIKRNLSQRKDNKRSVVQFVLTGTGPNKGKEADDIISLIDESFTDYYTDKRENNELRAERLRNERKINGVNKSIEVETGKQSPYTSKGHSFGSVGSPVCCVSGRNNLGEKRVNFVQEIRKDFGNDKVGEGLSEHAFFQKLDANTRSSQSVGERHSFEQIRRQLYIEAGLNDQKVDVNNEKTNTKNLNLVRTIYQDACRVQINSTEKEHENDDVVFIVNESSGQLVYNNDKSFDVHTVLKTPKSQQKLKRNNKSPFIRKVYQDCGERSCLDNDVNTCQSGRPVSPFSDSVITAVATCSSNGNHGGNVGLRRRDRRLRYLSEPGKFRILGKSHAKHFDGNDKSCGSCSSEGSNFNSDVFKNVTVDGSRNSLELTENALKAHTMAFKANSPNIRKRPTLDQFFGKIEEDGLPQDSASDSSEISTQSDSVLMIQKANKFNLTPVSGLVREGGKSSAASSRAKRLKAWKIRHEKTYYNKSRNPEFLGKNADEGNSSLWDASLSSLEENSAIDELKSEENFEMERNGDVLQGNEKILCCAESTSHYADPRDVQTDCLTKNGYSQDNSSLDIRNTGACKFDLNGNIEENRKTIRSEDSFEEVFVEPELLACLPSRNDNFVGAFEAQSSTPNRKPDFELQNRKEDSLDVFVGSASLILERVKKLQLKYNHRACIPFGEKEIKSEKLTENSKQTLTDSGSKSPDLERGDVQQSKLNPDFRVRISRKSSCSLEELRPEFDLHRVKSPCFSSEEDLRNIKEGRKQNKRNSKEINNLLNCLGNGIGIQSSDTREGINDKDDEDKNVEETANTNGCENERGNTEYHKENQTEAIQLKNNLQNTQFEHVKSVTLDENVRVIEDNGKRSLEFNHDSNQELGFNRNEQIPSETEQIETIEILSTDKDYDDDDHIYMKKTKDSLENRHEECTKLKEQIKDLREESDLKNLNETRIANKTDIGAQTSVIKHSDVGCRLYRHSDLMRKGEEQVDVKVKRVEGELITETEKNQKNNQEFSYDLEENNNEVSCVLFHEHENIPKDNKIEIKSLTDRKDNIESRILSRKEEGQLSKDDSIYKQSKQSSIEMVENSSALTDHRNICVAGSHRKETKTVPPSVGLTADVQEESNVEFIANRQVSIGEILPEVDNKTFIEEIRNETAKPSIESESIEKDILGESGVDMAHGKGVSDLKRHFEKHQRDTGGNKMINKRQSSPDGAKNLDESVKFNVKPSPSKFGALKSMFESPNDHKMKAKLSGLSGGEPKRVSSPLFGRRCQFAMDSNLSNETDIASKKPTTHEDAGVKNVEDIAIRTEETDRIVKEQDAADKRADNEKDLMKSTTKKTLFDFRSGALSDSGKNETLKIDNQEKNAKIPPPIKRKPSLKKKNQDKVADGETHRLIVEEKSRVVGEANVVSVQEAAKEENEEIFVPFENQNEEDLDFSGCIGEAAKGKNILIEEEQLQIESKVDDNKQSGVDIFGERKKENIRDSGDEYAEARSKNGDMFEGISQSLASKQEKNLEKEPEALERTRDTIAKMETEELIDDYDDLENVKRKDNGLKDVTQSHNILHRQLHGKMEDAINLEHANAVFDVDQMNSNADTSDHGSGVEHISTMLESFDGQSKENSKDIRSDPICGPSHPIKSEGRQSVRQYICTEMDLQSNDEKGNYVVDVGMISKANEDFILTDHSEVIQKTSEKQKLPPTRSFSNSSDSSFEEIGPIVKQAVDYEKLPTVGLPALLKESAADDEASDLQGANCSEEKQQQQHHYVSYSKSSNMKDHAAKLGIYTRASEWDMETVDSTALNKLGSSLETEALSEKEAVQIVDSTCVFNENALLDSINIPSAKPPYETPDTNGFPIDAAYQKTKPFVPIVIQSQSLTSDKSASPNVAKVSPFFHNGAVRRFAEPVQKFGAGVFNDVSQNEESGESANHLITTNHQIGCSFKRDSPTQGNLPEGLNKLKVLFKIPREFQKHTAIEIGMISVDGFKNWIEVEEEVFRLLMGHIERIDKSCLGISKEDITQFHIGRHRIAIGTKEGMRKNKMEDGQKTDTVEVQGDGFNSAALLAYQSVVPKRFLEKYISLVLNHQCLIFCGPSGTGKSYLTNKIADAVALSIGANDNNNIPEPIHLVNVNAERWKELKKLILGKVSALAPIIIVVDGFSHDFQDGIENLSLLLKQFSNKKIYVIAAVNHTNTQKVTLKWQTSMRWIWLDNNEEPVVGLLIRFLRKKFLQFNSSTELDDLFRIADWISSLWKRLNEIIENFHSAEQSIGPAMFFSCPTKREEIEEWFADLWNYSLVPYVLHTIRTGLKLFGRRCEWVDPLEWVMETYPWRHEENMRSKLKKIRKQDVGYWEPSSGDQDPASSSADQTRLMDFLRRLETLVENKKIKTETKPGTTQRRIYLESTL